MFFIFIKTLDLSIARNTWDNYPPGLTVPLEGFIYAVVGIIIGMALFFGLKKGLLALGRQIFKKKDKSSAELMP